MKLNRIKALCMENKTIDLVNAWKCQWLGNGQHYYRVFGAKLEIDELDKLMDAKETKACECEWNALDRRDSAAWNAVPLADDVPLEPMADEAEGG